MKHRKLTAVLVAVLAALLTGSCDDDVTGPGEGSIEVRLAMTGNAPDPDGCTVSVDGGAERAIFAGESVLFTSLQAGSHVVRIADLAEHCAIQGENPRIVSVSRGQTAEARFDADCEVPVGDRSDLWALISGIGAYEEGTPLDELIGSEETTEERGGIQWQCTVETRSAEAYPDDYATFDPNAEVVWPGSMLQGATLVNATPEPVVVKRAGGTVVINLLNGSEGVFQQVQEVRQSTIVQAINDIIRANEQDVFPARFTYNSSQVTSHQHMALELGVNYQTLGFKFKSNLAFSTDRDYNRFLVQFNQSFYTVSFDLPSSLDDLFAPEVTAEDLATYVGPGNPPTYISSVTYGRRFFLLVESTSSAMDMQASIKASYDAAVSEGAIDLEAAYVNTLENVNIKVFALGGDQSLAMEAFNGSVEGLRAFLVEGGDIRTGVPLSYVVRNVVDNQIVNVKVATTYDVKTCVAVGGERLYHGFATTEEGWTARDNGNEPVRWKDSAFCEGDAGGCISLSDGSGGWMYFQAPRHWRDGANLEDYYGGELQFDMRIAGGDNEVSPFNERDVIIGSQEHGDLNFTFPEELVHEFSKGWYRVTIYLSADSTVFNIGGVDYKGSWDGDSTHITDILRDVNRFLIRAERRVGDDRCDLDEVSLTKPTQP